MTTSRPDRDVLVLGSINLDQIVVTDHFPTPGQTLLGLSTSSTIGGKGANQAVAAALAGSRTAIMAAVGDDSPGHQARAELAARGVDVCSVFATDRAPTGTAWITVAGADNTIIVVPGANHAWPPPHIEAIRDQVADTPVVLCQLEIPLALVESAAAATHGMFVLNAAPAAPLTEELIARCTVLVVNETELAGIAGRPVDSRSLPDVQRAHGLLLERGATSIVTTLGPAGAVWATTSEHGHVAALRVADVVDTTGAGDAFCGVLASRLAAGDRLSEAVRWGVAAGSLSVRRATAQDSYADYKTLIDTITQEKR